MASATTGITELTELIGSMKATLWEGTLVYATLAHDSPLLETLFAVGTRPSLDMLFKEREGWSVILPSSLAEKHEIPYVFECRRIELGVHSSLDAVGFLAAITTRLAKIGVGVNPISAYFHDHLYVPAEKAEIILQELNDMADESRQKISHK